MSNPTDLKLAKWPFFAGDAVLLVFAYFIYARHAGSPMTSVDAALFLCSGVAGAALAVAPFLVEYLAAAKMVETSGIVSTVAQIQNLELVAGQISGATAQWQGVQEHANRTVNAAKEIGDRMAAETSAFTEFLKQANDTERATLRLEIEKMRRAESDWLQIVVRMLDHTYALHQAAVRSGQAGLIDQLGQFQNSCRDVARRIGLVPLIPAANDPFDSKCHETPESHLEPAGDLRVRNTIATGYTYQGRMIRPALVALQSQAPNPIEPSEMETTIQSNGAPAKPEPAAEEQSLL